jgi:membrane protein implicated in regulation of membrane protease activity
MDFWTAVVIIVALTTFGQIVTARRRAKSSDVEEEKRIEELMGRMVKMEDRLANLETLVLEREKRRPFDELLHKA